MLFNLFLVMNEGVPTLPFPWSGSFEERPRKRRLNLTDAHACCNQVSFALGEKGFHLIQKLQVAEKCEEPIAEKANDFQGE